VGVRGERFDDLLFSQSAAVRSKLAWNRALRTVRPVVRYVPDDNCSLRNPCSRLTRKSFPAHLGQALESVPDVNAAAGKDVVDRQSVRPEPASARARLLGSSHLQSKTCMTVMHQEVGGEVQTAQNIWTTTTVHQLPSLTN
jgi:hypothetical protein